MSDSDHWVFDGLELRNGNSFGSSIKLVGHEADGLEVRIDGAKASLTFADGALGGTQLLAFADCTDWGEWDFWGWPPVRTPGNRLSEASLGGTATMIFRQLPGEGMLFCAPTTDWVFGLVTRLDWTETRKLEPAILVMDLTVSQITRNVLSRCMEAGAGTSQAERP